MKIMTKSTFTVGLLAVLMALPAFGGTVNKSVSIEPGTTANGASSVNGSVNVGANAVVTGDVDTVNGKVRVDTGATVSNASTVNGSVRLADNVNAMDVSTVNGSVGIGPSSTIEGMVEAVNGSINIESGTSVAKDVSNVNGEINLEGANIGGDVSTVTGDINIVNGSVVSGDVVVKKPSGWNWGKSWRKPRIVIGPGATVVGTIKLEREVKLFISERASVGGVAGEMSMDDAVRFSGDQP